MKKNRNLRFFVEKSCLDWYSSMLIKLSLYSDWSEWKKNFCETYGNKGWSPSRYALSFKYKTGSLLDYAIKKEKLLLEVRKTIDTGTLIDVIAAGLPDFIADKIDRESLEATEDIFKEVGKLEHLVNKKKIYERRNNSNSEQKEKPKPCTICEKLGKGARFHPETSCWFKTKENEIKKNDHIKFVNNSQLEAELNNKDPKN